MHSGRLTCPVFAADCGPFVRLVQLCVTAFSPKGPTPVSVDWALDGLQHRKLSRCPCHAVHDFLVHPTQISLHVPTSTPWQQKHLAG